MKQSTQEWIEKAEGDWVTAQREVRARKAPNYDAAGFHAEQCVEKYLKACLEGANITFSKTHNLIYLLNQILLSEPLWKVLLPALIALNDYALDARYPGFAADKTEAKLALNHCRVVRRALRLSLGIPI